jgi:hypothetical protein
MSRIFMVHGTSEGVSGSRLGGSSSSRAFGLIAPWQFKQRGQGGLRL